MNRRDPCAALGAALAAFVDRILKGAKPADISVPQSLLVRADRVLE